MLAETQLSRRDALDLIEANTSVQSTPLCPEIRLRLIREDASVWHAADKHLFDDAGLRPYWAFCWGSGQALARYLLDHPDLVRDRRVLDFGSGSGVVAIAAAKAGAADVTAVDVDPLALRAIEINAALNRVAVTPSNEDAVQQDGRDWDVLTAGDVCYLSTNHDWLCRVADEGRVILLADPGRPGLATDRLDELARFSIRTVPDLEHPSLKEAAVYRFRSIAVACERHGASRR